MLQLFLFFHLLLLHLFSSPFSHVFLHNQSVQSERLSMEEYLDRIRARLARDEVLLRYLTSQQHHQQQHAPTDEMDDMDGVRSELAENVVAVHQRIDIMRTEIQNAVADENN